MHCEVEKIGFDPMSMSPDNPLFRLTMLHCYSTFFLTQWCSLQWASLFNLVGSGEGGEPTGDWRGLRQDQLQAHSKLFHWTKKPFFFIFEALLKPRSFLLFLNIFFRTILAIMSIFWRPWYYCRCAPGRGLVWSGCWTMWSERRALQQASEHTCLGQIFQFNSSQFIPNLLVFFSHSPL